MDQNVAQFLPVLLPLAGAALQWFRQFSSFKEPVYYGLAFVAATGCYLLTTSNYSAGWRMDVIHFLMWLPMGMPAVLGGTFMASGVAKAIVAKNPAAQQSVAVPLTNSKL